MDSSTCNLYEVLQFEKSRTTYLSIPSYAKVEVEDEKKFPTHLSKIASMNIIAQSSQARVLRYQSFPFEKIILLISEKIKVAFVFPP